MTKKKNKPAAKPTAKKDDKAPAEKTGNTSGTTDQAGPTKKDQPPISDESLQDAHNEPESDAEPEQPDIPKGFRRFDARDFLTALAEVREEIANIRLLAGQTPKRDHTFSIDQLRSGLVPVEKTKES